MKTIAVVVGTRPEAIKLAPVILRLRARPTIGCHVVASAQHRGLLDQALADFGLSADCDLDLMRPGQSLAGLTARAVEALDKSFAAARPDLVLVQGDTTTAFSAALAAFYQGIPVGHVEAGLRTGDLSAPWPEEANRALIARLARLHFAPTEGACVALRREGIDPAWIHVTGNTSIDALFQILARQSDRPHETNGRRGPTVLITAHRRESFGEGLDGVFQAIADLADRFAEVEFLYPVHPNPKVRGPVARVLARTDDSRLRHGNVRLVDPLPYARFVAAMSQASLILTDSGGIQEEAPSLGTPVLVLRDCTERPEALASGLVRLVGTDRARIVAEAALVLNNPTSHRRPARGPSPYGDGHAADRIAAICAEFLDS